MSKLKFLSIFGCLSGIAACLPAESVNPNIGHSQKSENAPAPSKAESKNANKEAPQNQEKAKEPPSKEKIKQYFTLLGYMQSAQSGLAADFCLSDEEIESVLEGMRLGLRKQTPPYQISQLMAEAQAYFHQRQQDDKLKNELELQKQADINRKAGEAFLKKLKTDKPAVKSTASGLHYEIIKEGDAKRATGEDSVLVTYRLQLIDGKQIESTDTPVTLPLQGVILGIKEGLQLIGNSGEINLYIPENLAYGSKDILGIPPGSLLIFNIKVNQIISMQGDTAEKEANKTAEDQKK
jgi:FKBP-type peptidyl-prolyl cis-trans isomerase